jgi:glucose/arabinose dehydrogenase
MMPPVRLIPLLLLLMILSTAGCQKSTTPPVIVIPETKMVPFVTGFYNPVCIANAGDSRLFVVEQSGSIRIVNSQGIIQSQPFLDISSRVLFSGERGLLGVAFHPHYSSNGYFYLNYVDLNGNTSISRFKVNAANPDLADPQSELRLLYVTQPYTNHKGGDLNFGADGYLYFGLGDGGYAGDPGNRAQNPKEYLGKLHRLDVNQGTPYAIPVTNPFYNNPDTLNEIWVLGLRNPWRFSFDRLTKDLWIADVGESAIEEIDFQPAADKGGENYGWHCYEGNVVYDNTGCAPASKYTFPIYTYPHGPECSITGGYVYRGSESSLYYGHYFFADYCSDRIWTLHRVGSVWVKEVFGQYPGNHFCTFGEDSKGQLYLAGLSSGIIYLVLKQEVLNTH